MAVHFILRFLAVLILASSLALASVEASTHVDDSYIITLRQSLAEDRLQDHLQWVDDTHQAVFNVGEFRGYGGHFDEETINEIKSHPLVVRVEQNQFVGVHGIATQKGTWGLGTISSRVPGQAQYLYDSSAGQDTWAYVLDTGINVDHQDFGGRAVKGADCGNVLCLPGGNFTDTLGHGTHVAGVIAGTRFGVAKKANIVDVKVAGTNNAITVLSTVSALNWAYNDMESKGRTNRSVINLSVGGQCNRKLDKPHGCPHAPYWGLHGHEAELDIIEMLYQRGVLTIVAAGNDDTEASWVAPAAAPNALTVGAIDRAWTEAGFSNYGAGVNILAPGVNITSAGNRYSDDSRVFGGTSMAVPHVTGLALYLKALENITDPRLLVDRIMGLASHNSFGLHKKGSPRLVVNNGLVDLLSSLNKSVPTTSGVDVPMPTTEVVTMPTINGTLTSTISVSRPGTDATTMSSINSTLTEFPPPPTDAITMSTMINTLTSSVETPTPSTNTLPPSNNASMSLQTNISVDAPTPAAGSIDLSTDLSPTPTTASSGTGFLVSTPIRGDVFSAITRTASTEMASVTRQSVSTALCESDSTTRQDTAMDDDCMEANEPTPLQSVVPIDTEPVTVDISDPTIGSDCLDSISDTVPGCNPTPRPTSLITVSAADSLDSSTAADSLTPTKQPPSFMSTSSIESDPISSVVGSVFKPAPDEGESIDAPPRVRITSKLGLVVTLVSNLESSTTGEEGG
ncbi:alkaline proteinase [Ophiocordyceps camponoti-floridani]|uniref:Alkaline proteinase n=1 Tax=Ophiocordyceps camponoti-floridani TaxID=2030778 RepID=A0A8H4VED4_9HYPO|nr:alkaline proteinase [Ophiocordyceps camponoti-floridani]